MKKLTKTLLLTAALSAGLSMPAMAANVQATLPSFPVMLNGTVIDNSYRQYPLLVYNNITYFPMTYYDCRFLGVETEWTQANGLKIEKSNLTGAYHQQNVQQKNSGKVTAQLATGKIAVNGKAITNSKEQYPLLVYRDVTYFPLTWRFAVDEFGWKYSYDNKNGLVIDAGNAKTSSVTLQDMRQNRGISDNSDFIIDKSYLYYQGKQGEIYSRPLVNLMDGKQRKTLLNVGQNYNYSDYALGEFTEVGGDIYLYYHAGSNLMGSNEYWLLDGGTAQKLVSGKSSFYALEGFQIINPTWNTINPQKLIYKDSQGERLLGEENMVYGSGRFGMYTWDKQLYCLQRDKAETDYVAAVDLQTGKTTKVSQYPCQDFQVNHGMLYYLCYTKQNGQADSNYSQQYLYAVNLATGKEQYVGYVGMSDSLYKTLYAAASNGVYYRDQTSGALIFYNAGTGKRDILNGGFKVNWLTEQNGYVIAGFEEHPKSSCRLAVYQSTNGGIRQMFYAADCSDKAVINANGLLAYRLEGTNQLVQVQL